MSTNLHRIALKVEQAGHNRYNWLLIKSLDGQAFVLETARQTYSTYMAALDAGYARLSALGPVSQSSREPALSTQQGGQMDLTELHDAT